LLKSEIVYINGDGETSRDFCFVANAVQANLLAACSAEQAKNQVYNIAVGERTSLNSLFFLILNNLATHGVHLEMQPSYQDFRAGDVLHSQAEIGKAKRLLGYSPSDRKSYAVAFRPIAKDVINKFLNRFKLPPPRCFKEDYRP
jgi:UDP-N-acetylglucosamine 4-epimerase